ncbi:hypothetical protein EC845_0890 [Comamonas sp. BIGb0124]|uniref:hypothetical protein n=1 Tax=Comamonas sp. BIGb0124 TaxID=2485130 RepID=UPI000F4805B2|nr:hypothetical protein [Comamonas sp. BIGb0124]ROR24856.1 hypothetical protein EC845_0890 [Comamonas sp. BIGb0124]
MPDAPSRPRHAFRLVLFFALAYCASYAAAPWLPPTAGWENGPVENLQAGLLFAGGLLALHWRRTAAQAGGDAGRSHAVFWLMVAPIWFVLCARELSWGTVFMTPLAVVPELGPMFSSSQQLPYKPLVAPVIALILVWQLVLFVRTRQDRTLQRIWRGGGFPLVEIGLCVVGMLLSAEAEGHGFIGFSELSHAAQQTLEELAELWAYIALLLAQWRVARTLGPRQGALN